MLNPIASSEAIYSATYVDNYIDSVENLPDDVQRHLSRIRDIDVQYRGHLRDVDYYYDLWKSLPSATENSANRRARAISRMQSSLIHAQELGDEKMQIVNQLQELIDLKTRQLDSDQKNLDIKEEQHVHQHHTIRSGDDSVSGATPQKVSRSQSPNGGNSLTCVVGSSVSTLGVGHTSMAGVGKESSTAFSTVTASVSSGGIHTSTIDRTSAGPTVVGTGVSSNGNNNNNGNSNVNNNSSSNNSNNSNTASGDLRSTSKRSRRQRNDVNSSAMELGGNESNSANEGGGSGDRGSGPAGSGGGSSGSSNKQSNANQSSSTTTQKKSGAGGASGNLNTTGGVGGASGSTGTAASSKKKKRKARGGQTSNTQANIREDTPPVDPIDPDEPTYCLCDQISFGEMILCDNDLCPIEWFHFSCVSLVLKPKGKWYCPNCRGDRPNVMKPKAQFLKELERYNKEKEEKT